MATAHDVAAYILRKTGEITAMKLEKLVYYSQAWSLVWDEEPLFKDRIEAWVNVPWCRHSIAVTVAFSKSRSGPRAIRAC